MQLLSGRYLIAPSPIQRAVAWPVERFWALLGWMVGRWWPYALAGGLVRNGRYRSWRGAVYEYITAQWYWWYERREGRV